MFPPLSAPTPPTTEIMTEVTVAGTSQLTTLPPLKLNVSVGSTGSYVRTILPFAPLPPTCGEPSPEPPPPPPLPLAGVTPGLLAAPPFPPCPAPTRVLDVG